MADILRKSKSFFLFCLISSILISCDTQLTPKKDLTNVGVAIRLALSGLSTVQVGACVPYLVISQDADGNSSAVESDLVVLLSALGLGQFFVDPSCAIGTSFTSLPAGNSSALFYYKNDNVQSDTISVSTTGLLGKSQVVNVDGPSHLALDGPDLIKSEECKLYRVNIENPSGNSRNALADVIVNLLGAGSGSFFSDSACTTAITTLTVSLGTSFEFVYYKNDVVEDVVLQAEDSVGNLQAGSLPVSINGPTKLAISGPSPVLKSACSAYNVEARNPSDVATGVNTDTTVNLTGAGTGQFYSDANCNTVAGSVLISSGNTNAMFYYQNASAGSVTLTASDAAANLTDGTLPVTIDEASKLAISGPASLGAGACAAYEVISQDGSGAELGVSTDTTVNLTSTGSGAFFSDAGCNSGISSVEISAFSSRAGFYFMDNTTEDVTLTAADAAVGLAAGTLPVSIAGASKLAILGSTDILTNVCEKYTVEAQNGAGAATAVTSNTTVNLSGGGLGNFFSDSNCSSPTSSVLISNGSTSADFYFLDTVVDTAVLDAADAAGILTAAPSFTVNVTAPIVAVLEISEDPSYDYGTVAVGNSADHTFTVSNTGAAPATDMKEAAGVAIATPFGFKDGSYPGTGGTCAAALNQGDDCTIVVTYTPTAEVLSSDNIAISYNNASVEVIVEREVKGTGGPAGSGNGGDLDTTFGGDGTVVSNYGSNDILHGVTVQQADGKIVVAGTVVHNTFGDYDFALLRYNADGTLDTTFGSNNNGLVLTDIRGTGGDDVAYGVALQSTGKIIVVGYSQTSFGTNQSLAIARFNTNGTLDTTFGGGDGIVLTQISTSNNDQANAVVIDSSDRIVVVGRAGNLMIFARYTSAGSLDTSFGTTGVRSLTGIATFHSALAVAIQSDGKIVAGGYASEADFLTAGLVTVRLNTNGSADTSYAGDGVQVTPISSGFDMARGIAVQSDGKIVVAGTSFVSGDSDFTVVRYTSAGVLDTTFDTDGIVTTRIDSGNHVAEAVSIDSNGKIVIAGYVDRTTANDLFVVGRYNTDGSLDTSFATDGTAEVGGGRAHGMTIQSDGKILAVGESSGGSFALARFLE